MTELFSYCHDLQFERDNVCTQVKCLNYIYNTEALFDIVMKLNTTKCK